MPDANPLVLLNTPVEAAWIDYNGHLNDACYALLFSRACDRLIDYIGLDGPGRESHQYTIYTLENHIRYLGEVHLDAPVSITAQILGADDKRLRVYFRMWDESRDRLAAVSTQLLTGVDTRGPKAAPFPEIVAKRVNALAEAHANLPAPADACTQMRLATQTAQRH